MRNVRNIMALLTVCIILVSCGLVSGSKDESPIIIEPERTPTPALSVSVTPEPTPSGIGASVPEISLRALLIVNAQLSRGITQMNLLIDTCNQAPDLCQNGELIMRLDQVNSAIGDVLQYADFLQPTPTPGVTPTP